MVDSDSTIPETGTLSLPDKVWQEARRREAIISPLAEQEKISTNIAKEAGVQLGLSARTIYTLVRRYKNSGGSILSLAPGQSQGGRGGSRLSEDVERIISTSISKIYLSRQKSKISTVVKDIRYRCFKAGLKPPSSNTVRSRVNRLHPVQVALKREGRNAARRLDAAGGTFPAVSRPLEVVQMDHTRVDVIVVDQDSRQPIGRPWITLGIDIYSRCITGFCLTLDPPSAVSVGLCLAHGANEKQAWLERLDITATWPIHGKPILIHVDNAGEFHSEALRRGCDVNGIKIEYRPKGAPHFGGIIERVVGTFMQMVHELPGTTFSNTAERGDYDSERKASLTLTELEKWFALAIIGDHSKTGAKLTDNRGLPDTFFIPCNLS